MEYTILSNGKYSELADDVLALIDEGWVPCGGVSICKDGLHFMYAQAMTRTQNELGGH